MMPTRLAGFAARSAFAFACPLALVLAAAGPASGADSPPVPTPAPAPSSPPGAAPGPEQLQAARELFGSASRDEDASRWADALGKLHRVAEVKLTAGVRYHIALCEEKLGLIASAFASYAAAREAADGEHNKEVLELLADPFLPNLRARIPMLAIEIPSDAAGVSVTIDGRPYTPPASGALVPIDPGFHRIEASAPGRGTFTKELTLRERDVTMLDVTLPSVTVSAFPSAAPAPAATVASSPAAAPSLLLPILSTVGAVAFIGGGVAAFSAAASAQSTGQAECLTRTSCDDLRTPVRTWDAVALGAWIGGAALATTAIVLWVRPPRQAPEPAANASSARLTLGPAQLRFEGSF